MLSASIWMVLRNMCITIISLGLITAEPYITEYVEIALSRYIWYDVEKQAARSKKGRAFLWNTEK